jgi:integrase
VPGTNSHQMGGSPAAGGSAESIAIEDPLASYFYAIKSKATKRQYIFKLRSYFNYLGIQGDDLQDQTARFLAQASKDHSWAQGCLIGFITHLKKQVENKEITGGTLKNYYASIKLFHEQNDLQVNWKKISRGLPEVSSVANDRAPTENELRKLIQAPDIRVKVIVLVMISSGIRLGAWDNLKLKHLTPIYSPQNPQEVIAAKLKVYDGLANPYTTFISKEAWHAIQEYIEFRKSYGEAISDESWILRDKFPTTPNDMKNAARKSLATNPVKLEVKGVSKVLRTAFYVQGLRDLLPKGERRHQFKLSHGFRKYYKTNAERGGMLAANVEKLMDHSMNITDSYWRPTEDQLLQDYLKVADDYVSITNNKVEDKLVNQLQNDIMQKLVERENEIESIRHQFEMLQKNQEQMIKQAVNSHIVDEWLNMNIPETVDMLLRQYLVADPEDGKDWSSEEEHAQRKRWFSEFSRSIKKRAEEAGK